MKETELNELVVTLKPEMLEVVKKAMRAYTGDRSSREYQEIMKQIMSKEEK